MTSLAMPQRRHLLTLAAVAAVAGLATFGLGVGDALAQGGNSSNVFSNLNNKSQDLFYNVRTIVLILCALAIIVTMATAISGRFPITKALAICGAILVIGMASQIVTYFAGSTAQTSGNSTLPNLTDTSGSSP